MTAVNPITPLRGFRNPEPDSRQQGDLQRWRRERKAQGLPHPPRQGYDQFITQWWQPADLNGEDDRLWWLGHAALLMRINQHYILIDPALSRRASLCRLSDLNVKRRLRWPLTSYRGWITS